MHCPGLGVQPLSLPKKEPRSMPKSPKQLAFGDEARIHLREGVTKLARAVKSTLGPAGRCAVIDRGWGEPLVTKDGASVAEEVDLANPYENLASKLLRAA